jgi:signal transduction histidine kinase
MNPTTSTPEAPTAALPRPLPLVHMRQSLGYEYPETRALVERVEAAALRIRERGEAALPGLAITEAQWCKGAPFVFVLDLQGMMLVHPDPVIRGWNQLGHRDLDGRPFVRSILDAVTHAPDITEGWVHGRFPVPGGVMPRWMSTFALKAAARGGREFVVCSSMYNDRMERAFVVDMVHLAVSEVERMGVQAFAWLRDPLGPWLVKDAHVFVTDMDGVAIVEPEFPMLEGVKLIDQADVSGMPFYREMVQVVSSAGEGWVDYLWQRPGEGGLRRKSVFVRRATLGSLRFVVGCGVYLPGAPAALPVRPAPTPDALVALVREAAQRLSREGEGAHDALRRKGTRWFRDGTYVFVFTTDGRRVLHPAEPETEGRNDIGLRDAEGRAIVRMIIDAALSPEGGGWVHYLYPEPGGIIPVWKSSYVRKVDYPDGQVRIVGSGIYRMRMEASLVEDLVKRAATLVASEGRRAFPLLRDRKGPFAFMDTYVFVETPSGLELVNPVHPFLEGRYLLGMRDLGGHDLVREEIDAAVRLGEAWVDGTWYRPGDNVPARKHTYVRRTVHDGQVYIVGSGYYSED